MSIKIWLNTDGIENGILNGSGIESAEREVAERILSGVQGQFIIDFGIEGNFVIETRKTEPSKRFGSSRTAFKISAADARTTAILNRHPGWLDKFI